MAVGIASRPLAKLQKKNPGPNGVRSIKMLVMALSAAPNQMAFEMYVR